LSDQDELEKIKQRKLKRLLERAEKMQSMKDKEEEVQQEQETRAKEARSYILARTLDREASNYLAQLRNAKPETAQQIESIIVTLVLQKRLDYVTKVHIRALERRIEGVEPSILVKRRGKEAETLSDAIRGEHD
jgi:DNA-binding TFAR19-related protein (PDSD5 family)